MPLIVPATGGFAIGSNLPNNEPKTGLNMSLDDVIKNRRQETVKQSRRGGGGGARASTADRSIATGRAKRQAAMNARRNLTPTKKASKMDIDREVQAQTARTQKTKDRQDQKKAGGRVAAAGGSARRRGPKKAGGGVPIKQTNTKQASAQVAGTGRAPSKKAVNAAVEAFKANGFEIPQGTQMVIRFETPQAQAAPNARQQQQPQGGGGGGRGGGGRSGGRGGGGPNNNNNANRNRNRRGGGGGGGGRGRN